MTELASSEIKKSLRADALRRRQKAHDRLGPSAAAEVASIGRLFLQGHAGPIASGYLPIKAEINPVPLLAELEGQGRRLCLPVIVAKNAPLIFRAWRPGEPLAEAEMGLREPLAASPEVTPDIVIVPIAAFDSAGYRIGYGGGYYDRTLEKLRAAGSITAIGIAYDEQEVPVFPHEPHDAPLDFLITPTGVRSFRAAA